MKYNQKLVDKLYQKYKNQGTMYYRQEMADEYEKMTGEKITIGSLERYIRASKKTFNERTDEIVDVPTGLYDEKSVIEAMGFDSNKFSIERITANRWWTDGIKDNEDVIKRIKSGQIKVHLRQKKFEFSEESMNLLLEKANIKPVWVDESVDKPSGLLELTLTDMHKLQASHLETDSDWTVTWQ